MALYLINQNAVFLHVPKTAGVYIKELLARLVKCKAIGHMHDTLGTVKGYRSDLWNTKPPFVFAFVRYPVSWYRSYFSFREGESTAAWRLSSGVWKSWGEGHVLENIDSCADSNINEFIFNCAERYPGFLFGLYKQYCMDGDKEIQFIGRYERLHVDLRMVLVDILGIDAYAYDKAVAEQPIVNASTHYVCMSDVAASAVRWSEKQSIDWLWR